MTTNEEYKQIEMRENDGTLVITEKDAPAGMGAIYPEDLSECQGFSEPTETKEQHDIRMEKEMKHIRDSMPSVHPWANTHANMGGLR